MAQVFGFGGTAGAKARQAGQAKAKQQPKKVDAPGPATNGAAAAAAAAAAPTIADADVKPATPIAGVPRTSADRFLNRLLLLPVCLPSRFYF